MDIESQNLVKLTGRISGIRFERNSAGNLMHAGLTMSTRFQKVNGSMETQRVTVELIVFQRHNKTDLDTIRENDIVTVTGEIKNQPLINGWTGNYTRMYRIFVYEITVLGTKSDNLLVEETKALTYD